MMNNLTDAQKEAIQVFIKEYLSYLNNANLDPRVYEAAKLAFLIFLVNRNSGES